MASVQLGGSVFLQLLRVHCGASDLGPVSLNWFEELTAEAVQRQPKLCDDEEKKVEGPDDSLFKTPKHKQPNYSQLDSTPIIFKEQSLCSPLFFSPARDLPKNPLEAENVRRVNKPERSPGDATQLLRNEVFGTSRACTNNSPSVMREMFKTPIWDKKYTHRTPQRDGKNDVFDSLFCTPKFIRNTTPRCISESLGVEADPEMSWSSSLATPPSPTVIIAQAIDNPSNKRPFDNKDVVIVQSLFSSKLCNDAETAIPTNPKIDKDLMDLKRKPNEHLADSAYAVPNKVHTSENSESTKVQRDNIKNEEDCPTTENVLEGMEDVLSIFFTRRKVKVDSRAKRRKNLNSSVVQESGTDQNILHLESHKSKLENKQALNNNPSSVPSSYEWSPLALPDLITTQGDMHFPAETDNAIYGDGEALGPKTNYSPTKNNGRCSPYLVPAGPCKVTNTLEIGISDTIQQKIPDRKLDVDVTCSAENTTSHTARATSVDLGLAGPQASVEINEGIPQSSSSNIKAKLSVLKKQSKFLYCLNGAKNGQEESTKDIRKVSNEKTFRVCEKDAGFGKNHNKLDSKPAQSQQEAQLVVNEDSEYIKDDSLDIQEIEENLLNLECVDRPISEQTPCLQCTLDISTTHNIEQGFEKTVDMKAGDATRKTILLESARTSNMNTLKDNAIDNVRLATIQVQETAKSSDVISDQKEQLESHKADTSTTTEHCNTCTDSLPLNISLCISRFQDIGGFKTASNKSIRISEANLRKGELLFKDDDPIHHIGHSLPPSTDVNRPVNVTDSVSLFSGFRTASCREIVVTESKIAKGMLLLKDIEDGLHENITNKDLVCRSTSNLLPGNEKSKGEHNILDPISKMSPKDKKQSSNPILLYKQSSIAVCASGINGQNMVFQQQSKDSITDNKNQMKETSLYSEIQNHSCEILTESQKAEVNELSSILENADSQFDFTQFRKTGIVALRNQNLQNVENVSESDHLNNSDVWKDVDFNDSFAAGAQHVESNDSGGKLSLETKENTVEATAFDSSVVLVSEELLSKEKERKFGGFSLASGKCIHINDEDMIKAFELFSDLDDNTLSSKDLSTEVNKRTNYSTVPAPLNIQQVQKDSNSFADAESDVVYSKTESCLKLEEKDTTCNERMFNIEKQKSKTKLVNEILYGGNEVSSITQVQNIISLPSKGFAPLCPTAMSVGFSTGKGKVISVNKASLAKAKSIFNDILHPEHIYRDQGGTSSVDEKENIGTSRQDEEAKKANKPSVEQSEQSAVSSITSEKNTELSFHSVQIPRPMFENIPGTEQAHRITLPKEDIVTKRVQFSTARGKPVHLSEESLNRARQMFADINNQQLETIMESSMVSLCEENGTSTRSASTNNLGKTLQEKESVLPSLGFSTANGKGLVISNDSLQKAKIMFAEVDVAIHEDGTWFHGTKSKHVHEQAEPKICGPEFQKDCSFNMEKNTQVGSKVFPHLGFSTVSGKTVAVSNESLHKARLMFADTDNGDMEHRCQSSQTTGGQEMCRVCVLSTLENRKPGRGLLESNPVEPPLRDKTISCCSEKPDLPPIVNTSKLPEAAVVPQEDKPNIIKPFFSTAGGKLVKMSDEALKKAREMFSEIDDGPIKKDSCTVKQNLERNNKRNNPKNRNLQNLASPTVTTKETTNSHPPSGFSTASGKTVAVSANALHKARILLSESDGNTDDSIGQIKKRTINAHCEEMAPVLKPRHSDTKEIEKNILVIKEETSENLSTIQASNSFLPGMSSFTTASAKTLTISEEALRKAKEMFSEIDNIHSEHDKPGDYPIDHPLFVSKVHPSLQKTQTILETSNLPNSTTNTFGFSTASGKHVSVSETAMQQVKDLFQEFTEPENPQESGLYYNKGGGNISKKANISTPKVNKQKFITDPADKLSNLQCRGRNVENNNVDTPPFASSSDQHPVPKHSTPFYATRVLNKNNFVSSIASHTPENYFEIEAAESAKAFMDDEDLTDGIMATETVNKPRNGKRLRSDDRTAHGEPPIKRQLLPEFDRSLVQGSKLTMKPLTSSPHSELKDRRKFLYNVSLKASFCDPTSLSAVKKEAKDSPLTTRRHCSSSSPSFQQPLSDNSANGAKDEKPQYKMVSHRQATSKSVSFFKMEVHMPLEEEARNQSDPDFHTDEGNLKQKACSELGSDFSQLVARLSCARDMQEMRIRKKQRQIIKPHSGILYQLKASSTERIPLFSAVQGKPPTVYTKAQLYRFGVLKNHIGINSETARTFHFHCLEYFTKDTLMPNGGVQIADGGWLVPSDRLTAGREEFYRALCDTTGVDPKLISPEWVYNHYRWIVWKLAAMEVMFPDMFASRCLTPERVLLQLKYRYEVEIDKSRRSAVRRIVERDDIAAKTLVLCVCKIISWQGNEKSESNDHKQGPAIIEVTDGWYGIKALLDPPLTALLHRGRLFVGQKIIVHGAELVGSEDACTPLEAPESLMLKLSANSTRPARWFTRLGYFHDPRPFCLPLSSLFAEGGIVGCVDIVIQRIYPMQWMEKLANGTYVFRNDRAEEREAERHASKQQKNLEALFLKIQEEFEQWEARERKAKSTRHSCLTVTQIAALQDGAEIYEAVQNEPDPGYLESCMSSEQLRALNHHRQLINDKKQALIQAEFRKAIESTEQGSEGCTKREVTPVWKMRIVDYREQDPASAYMLNIWRPLPDIVSLLKEGCRFKIYQLATSQSKSKADMAAVQLTATKKTRFQQLQPSQDILEQIYSERKVTDFSQLLQSHFTAEYGEVGIVGLVISTHEKIGAAPIVYLSNEVQEVVAVKFWADLSQLSLEELAKPGTFIAASNLRWRSEYTAGIPMVIAGDLSYIAANPKEQHLQKAIHKLRQSVQAVQKFRHEAETKLLNILKFPHPEGRRCLAQHNSDSHAATNKFSTPVAKFARAQMTPDRSNILIGSSGDMDPKISKKMKALDFLSRVPSPPLLTPVRPLVSPSLQRAFRPPRSMQKEEQTRQQPTLMSRGEFVADEELAMINTQVSGLEAEKLQPKPEMSADQQRIKISPYQSEGKANPSLGSHTNNITTTKKEDPSFTDQGALRKRRRHRL